MVYWPKGVSFVYMLGNQVDIRQYSK